MLGAIWLNIGSLVLGLIAWLLISYSAIRLTTGTGLSFP